MSRQKIRVFLGGYVNFLNAQNINCRALSEHLDPARFEVWTMLLWHQNASDFRRVPGVHYLRCRRPVRLFGWWPYVVGILHSDVAFLPKGEHTRLCRLVAWLCGCRTFTTVEGILDDVFLTRQPHPQRLLADYRRFEPRLYAITRHIAQREARVHGFHMQERILYLGVDSERFGRGAQITPPHTHGGHLAAHRVHRQRLGAQARDRVRAHGRSLPTVAVPHRGRRPHR